MLVALTLFLAAATHVSPAMPAAPAGNCAKARAFVGTICTPSGTGKHPALLVIGGSEGGDALASSAAEFARHGYVAASVAYFSYTGESGLPDLLQEIPVETIGKALDAVIARPDVDSRRVGIFGVSKGGEFALLAASTYPQIRAVVADVPSPFAWQSIPRGPAPTPESSWTLAGEPVPFVPYSDEMGRIYSEAFTTGKPVDSRVGYDASMRVNAASIPAAMFHLENIRGPVMMLSAGDDHIWDSQAQCAIGMTYLRDHHHPYPDVTIDYPQAGHLFLFATPDNPLISMKAGPLTIEFGGTAAANVAAANAAWPRVFSFLSSALK